MKALLTIVMLAACGCPQKTTSSTSAGSQEPATTETAPAPAPAPTPAPAPAPTPAPAPAPNTGTGSGSTAEPTPSWTKAAPGIGETCGANDACAKGLTCVSYYGIAGARGPQFKSCEIKCTGDKVCPADHKCITIADGPGQVCRKP
jgi:hypothetical protein